MAQHYIGDILLTHIYDDWD